MKLFVKTGVGLMLAAMVALGVFWATGHSRAVEKYATWNSLELDTQASIWLVERIASPGAHVKRLPNGREIRRRLGIAIPGTPLGRGASQSAFEKLVAHFDVSDPDVERLAGIVNAIEVSAWSSVANAEANTVEQTFRWLQSRYSHEVADSCYRAFFDLLYEQLQARDLSLLPIKVAHLTEQGEQCGPLPAAPDTPPVLLVPIDDVLAHIAADNDVVFIDVREASEFGEGHIPGSQNLTLREIDEATAQRLGQADLIIPYCIKDFRGYEAARKLAAMGLRQVGTMTPHGLAGWHSLELPVTTRNGSEAESLRDLRLRADSG